LCLYTAAKIPKGTSHIQAAIIKIPWAITAAYSRKSDKCDEKVLFQNAGKRHNADEEKEKLERPRSEVDNSNGRQSLPHSSPQEFLAP
jgi:hypothetical protein